MLSVTFRTHPKKYLKKNEVKLITENSIYIEMEFRDG